MPEQYYPAMSRSVKKILLKILKRSFITIGVVLLLLIAVPMLFPQAINRKITRWANSNLNGKIAFSGTRLSFFKHFPSLTLTLDNVIINGAAPFENDTLIVAKSIGLGIDLSSVLKSKITINKVFISDAVINIQVDSLGAANYNIYKKHPEATTAANDTNGASLGIKKILIENSRLVYNDQSIPMTINARGFNYTGSGDLSKDIFDLTTHTEIQSFDFYFNRQPYIISKKINADLVTEINTQTLAFIFRKNNLMINQLPVEFNGRFGFVKDGYDMDFNVDSHENDINVILSALPADYQKLFDNTDISGVGIIQLALSGKYIAKDSMMPDLSMSLKVRNGMVNNSKSPFPVKNLHIDMAAKMPHLNADSLTVNIDTLHFNVSDGYFNSVFRVKGLNVPDIYARVNAEIDLEKWHKALGIKPFTFKGKLFLNLQADGKYAKDVEHKGRGKTDTVITSIPKFKLDARFRDGYFKYGKLPGAIDHVSFDVQADCYDNNYKHINLALDNIDISAMSNYIKGYFKLGNTNDFPVDAALQAKIHLDDVKHFYPADSMDLKGDLLADIKVKGNYLPAKKKYPIVAATVNLQNGYVKTKYYPDPVSDIQLAINITDSTESLQGLNVNIKPLTFNFEGEPFSLKAKLKDFTNLQYKVKLKGKLDVGKIYQVFARKGYNVTGIVDADISLKGKQSDATAGNYDALDNKGSITVENLSFTSDIYPKPFLITRGVFRFNQEKIELDTFALKYANSTIILDGTATNVVDYFIKPGSVLQGDLNMQSDCIVVDDFMSAVPDTTHASAANTAPGTPGVILVPKNMNLTFTADVKQVRYTDMVIKDAQGQLTIRNDSILLEETGFNLIDAPIEMDAVYTAVNPKKAFFSYHISAADFDVQKAYKKIKLFHDIASSAEHAEGLISLDYHLSGYLNSSMMPVYPSLNGGGTITAEKIRMHGLKLFNAIGKETGRDSVGGDRDVAKVLIKSTIANNIITIAPTKMRLPPFRASFGGQVSFDKALNLQFRLGLPPLGLIGIPMTITGSEDKPDIHVGKGGEEEALKETMDNEPD